MWHNRRGSGSTELESKFDRANEKAVPVLQLTSVRQPLAVHERAVEAAEILKRKTLSVEANLCMMARDRGLHHADVAVQAATDNHGSIPEGQLQVLALRRTPKQPGNESSG